MSKRYSFAYLQEWQRFVRQDHAPV